MPYGIAYTLNAGLMLKTHIHLYPQLHEFKTKDAIMA